MRLSNQIVLGKIIGWTAMGTAIGVFVGVSELEKMKRKTDDRIDFYHRYGYTGHPRDRHPDAQVERVRSYLAANNFLNQLDETSRQATVDNGAIAFNGYDFPIRNGEVRLS